MKPKFESFIEELIPEINFLTISNEDMSPGFLLESKEEDYPVGHLKNHLDAIIKPEKWKPHFVDGDLMIPEDIAGSDHASAGLKVLKYLGLNFKRDMDFRINFSINEIQIQKIEGPLDKIDIELALRKLRSIEKRRWKKLLHNYMAFHLYYAASFEIEFEIGTNTSGDVGFNWQDQVEVEGEFETSWERNGTLLKVDNNTNVPFGATGYKIGRFNLKSW